MITGLQAQALANGTFKNNMVSLQGDVALAASDRFLFGMLDLSATPTVANYYFNSVNIYGTATLANNTYAFNRNGTTTVTLRDNIFANPRTGGTGFHIALANSNAAPATGWSATASDYNLLNNANLANLCQWDGSVNTLAMFQTNSGGDLNSFIANPLYVSDTDLHLTPASPAINRAIPFGGVTNDFDNELRTACPDIGADEVYPRGACPTPTPTPTATPFRTDTNAKPNTNANPNANAKPNTNANSDTVPLYDGPAMPDLPC